MTIPLTVFRITLFISFQSAIYEVITHYISLKMKTKKMCNFLFKRKAVVSPKFDIILVCYLIRLGYFNF